MKEYIEREAVLRITDKYGCGNGSVLGYHSGAVDCAGSEIARIPAADVVEVRHAKWVSLTPPLLLEEFREMEADKFFMCNECKGECQLVEQDDYYDYCPRCGCKMDKEE